MPLSSWTTTSPSVYMPVILETGSSPLKSISSPILYDTLSGVLSTLISSSTLLSIGVVVVVVRIVVVSEVVVVVVVVLEVVVVEVVVVVSGSL